MRPYSVRVKVFWTYMIQRISVIVLVLLVAAPTMVGTPVSRAQENHNQTGGPQKHMQPALGQAEMLQKAPNFELKNLAGKVVRLEDYRGKAILLNFWATWCAPCKTEMPWLVEFQKQYGPEGLVVLGIAMDASKETVRNFVKKMGVNYPVLLGTQTVADQYGGLKGLPVTFYIDRNGNITDQAPGLANRSTIENEIKLALINGTVPLRAR